MEWNRKEFHENKAGNMKPQSAQRKRCFNPFHDFRFSLRALRLCGE